MKLLNYDDYVLLKIKTKSDFLELIKHLNLDNVTGGRAVVSGHILTDRSDIFAANERGANYLFKNKNGINSFVERKNEAL